MDELQERGRRRLPAAWPFQVNLLQADGAPIAFHHPPQEGATGWADTSMLHVDAEKPELRLSLDGAHARLEPPERPLGLVRSANPVVRRRLHRRARQADGGRLHQERLRRLRAHPLLDDAGDALREPGRVRCTYYRWVSDYIGVIRRALNPRPRRSPPSPPQRVRRSRISRAPPGQIGARPSLRHGPSFPLVGKVSAKPTDGGRGAVLRLDRLAKRSAGGRPATKSSISCTNPTPDPFPQGGGEIGKRPSRPFGKFQSP